MKDKNELTNSTEGQIEVDPPSTNDEKIENNQQIQAENISTDIAENIIDATQGEIIQSQNNTLAESEDTEKTETSLELENKNCTLDRKRDERFKNIMTYSSIPFILTAIIISLFNIGKVRYPLSFLFITIGIGILAVCNYIRSVKLSKSCTCKDCVHHSKSSFKYAIMYGIVTLCFLGVFIYYMVI